MSKPSFPAGNLTPHKLAEYVPGQMSDEEFEALCESIRTTGQQLPIYIYEDQILDGRHRNRACTKVGVKPKYEQFKGTAEEAENFVIALNLQRKSINSMQKAIVGARLTLRAVNPLTQLVAAKQVGVGVNTLNLAVRLINSKNAPLIRRVEKGECSRSEVDEELYERDEDDKAGPRQANAADFEDGDDEDGDDEDEYTSANRANRSIGDGSAPIPTTGTKPKHSERKPTSTPANDCAQTFIGLDDANKKSFVDLVWFCLEPHVRKRLVTTVVSDETAPVSTETPKGKKPAKKTPAKKSTKKGSGK